MKTYSDRQQAGAALAEKLDHYSGEHALVLALPRGGVPVGAEIALKIDADLDVFNVRKLGLPWQPEVAMGAISEVGGRHLNEDIIRKANVSEDEIEAVAQKEQERLDRRKALFRKHRSRQPIEGRIIILVDDGLATGATMEVAIQAIRDQGPEKIVVAVPVGPPGTARRFGELADECICVMEPEGFSSIGSWYRNFEQVPDEEVGRILEDMAARVAS